jgi:hypothetical protein
MSEPSEDELVGVGVDAPPQANTPPGDVRSHPEAPGHLGHAAAEPTSGLLQVPSESLLLQEIEIDGGEATQPPASSEFLAASTVTTDGVAGTSLQQVMQPNSELPVSDENQDNAEDYEEPRPQVGTTSLPATSSSSSSFPTTYLQHSALEDLLALVDDSLPFTTDSADVRHDDIRLQDPTLQPGYRPRGDPLYSRASRSWEERSRPRRSLADEPEDRGRLLELRPGPPVGPLYTTFDPEEEHRPQLLHGEYRRQQVQRGVMQLVHERQLTVHARSIPGGFSRRVIAYAASSEASEAFRRAHPPQPESAFYPSSSEDDDCKYPDLEAEPAPGVGGDYEAWLQRQDQRRELLASQARSARIVGEGEPVPIYKRLAEIDNIIKKRLLETAEVSPWFASGVHWLCKLCGFLDPAMRGKNWVDNDDPGDERRVYGLGHEYCQIQAQRIVEERRLAQWVTRRSYASETELQAYLRASEDEAEFRAKFPSYRGPWPIPVFSHDLRDAYLHSELTQPFIGGAPRAPEPAVKLEPELDTVPNAIGQPSQPPNCRWTGRPTAHWDMNPASKHGEPIDTQACKYGDPNCTERRPKGISHLHQAPAQGSGLQALHARALP